jgi:hypothetical protein
MRSQSEIVSRIESINEGDFFGFRTSDLVYFLDFEHAKPYLQPTVTAATWTPNPSDRDSILKAMEEYMEFAWDKANNGRGISAGRSMDHYTEWVWMLGDEDVIGDLREYEYYGKDNLVKLCEHYGWDHTKWDDGVRENS